MLWIKGVEMVDSLDELKSSRSVSRKNFPKFEMRDAKIASALNKIIQNSQIKKKVSLEEQTAQKEDRFLRGRRIAYLIYEYFRVTGAHDTVLDYADLSVPSAQLRLSRVSRALHAGHLAEVGLVLGHPLPAFLHPVLASQSLLVRLVLLGLLVLPLPLLLKFLQVLRLLHVQSWLWRHPTLSTSSPTLTTAGTPFSTPTALSRLPTAQQQPSPSRPTPLELDGAPATSAVAARASKPSVPCGVRSERPFLHVIRNLESAK